MIYAWGSYSRYGAGGRPAAQRPHVYGPFVSHLDLSRAPYVLYGVKYIDPVSLGAFAPRYSLFSTRSSASACVRPLCVPAISYVLTTCSFI